MDNSKSEVKLRKKLRAEVVGVVDERTYKVRVQRSKQHPIYKKIIKSHKKYLVDYVPASKEDKGFKIGDQVTIEETSPKSKAKKFVILN